MNQHNRFELPQGIHGTRGIVAPRPKTNPTNAAKPGQADDGVPDTGKSTTRATPDAALNATSGQTVPSASDWVMASINASARAKTGRIKPTQSIHRTDAPGFFHRACRVVAVFFCALLLVVGIYRLFVSADFAGIALENGVTAALALLIGAFCLPGTERHSLRPRAHFGVCLTLLALTPWPYHYANDLAANGAELAVVGNFVFEVLLAVVLYRGAIRLQGQAT